MFFAAYRRNIPNGATFKYEYDRPFLAKAANKNLALEINTSSFKTLFKCYFPCAEIVKLFKSCGGRYITIGSDAHHLGGASYIQEKGIAVAQAGFHKISCYKKKGNLA